MDECSNARIGVFLSLTTEKLRVFEPLLAEEMMREFVRIAIGG